jgi:hypothetical protein
MIGGIYEIPGFINSGSGMQKFMGGIHRLTDTQTYRQHGDIISLLSFFQNTEIGQKLQFWLSLCMDVELGV